VIPWHNDSVGDFVTTFRCGDCVATSLADTRARLAAGDPRTVAQLADFFQRHAITVLEYRRGDPPEAVRPLLNQAIDMLERGAIVLQIGETVPLKEALSSPPSPPSSPPSAAPPAAAPSASLWQRLRRAFGRD
jgi:hypothetical protein